MTSLDIEMHRALVGVVGRIRIRELRQEGTGIPTQRMKITQTNTFYENLRS
jgi:hypothetical protein